MTLSPALALTRDLIRCPSVTPADAGALAVLEDALKAAGFEPTASSSPNPARRTSTISSPRSGRARRISPSPATPMWCPSATPKRWRFDPFAAKSPTARSTAAAPRDMKGAIAAFATAALDFVREHGAPNGAISLPHNGRRRRPRRSTARQNCSTGRDSAAKSSIIASSASRPIPLTIGDTIKIGRRGSLNGRIVVTGKQGHAAYPERAENPVPVIARIVAALSAHEFDRGNAHFDRSNLEVASIDVGNPATNVIPAEARAQFNIRFNDVWTLETFAGAHSRRGAGSGGQDQNRDRVPALQRAALRHAAGRLHRSRRARGARGHGPHAGPHDQRRHLRRAFHPARLPGAGIWPRQ